MKGPALNSAAIPADVSAISGQSITTMYGNPTCLGDISANPTAS